MIMRDNAGHRIKAAYPASIGDDEKPYQVGSSMPPQAIHRFTCFIDTKLEAKKNGFIDHEGLGREINIREGRLHVETYCLRVFVTYTLFGKRHIYASHSFEWNAQSNRTGWLSDSQDAASYKMPFSLSVQSPPTKELLKAWQ
jgi:hypothetical protein